MADSVLTIEDYKQILKNRFNNPKIKYVSSEIKPISENAEGFLGEHYKLQIVYSLEGQELKEYFFIKTKPTKNKLQAEAANNTGVYKKEIFLYDFLLKEFDKYGFDTSFASRCYYSIPNQTLVLEDLTKTGFILPERRKLFDLNSMKCLLKSLALFHGASIAYEQTKSKETKKYFELNAEYPELLQEIFLVMYSNPKGHANDWWISNFKTIEKLIEYLPENEEFKIKFKRLLKNANIGEIFVEETEYLKTLGHGDIWSNNMMFKYENNLPVKCCLFDYQILRYFYPSFDVLLSIYFNTDTQFRKKYFQELISFYYQSLKDILLKYKFDIDSIMSYDQFTNSIILVRADVLAQITCVKMIIYLPPEMLTKALEEDKNDTAQEQYNKQRNKTINAFLNCENYRKVITESLYDFYGALK